MRQIGILMTAIMAMVLPAQAMAAVYDFHSTETSALSTSPTSFTFSLNTSGAVFSGGSTNFANVSIDENGTTSAGNTVGAQFTTNISSPLFFFVDTGMMPFYSGSGPGITFNTGTFVIADGATDGEGSLTISSVPVASVPEPSTLSLTIVGVSMIGAMAGYRKRRKSEASAPQLAVNRS